MREHPREHFYSLLTRFVKTLHIIIIIVNINILFKSSYPIHLISTRTSLQCCCMHDAISRLFAPRTSGFTAVSSLLIAESGVCVCFIYRKHEHRNSVIITHFFRVDIVFYYRKTCRQMFRMCFRATSLLERRANGSSL